MNLLASLLYRVPPYPIPPKRSQIVRPLGVDPTKESQCLPDGMYWCSQCKLVRPESEMARRPQGDVAKTCQVCTDRRTLNAQRYKKRNLQYEY